jgi:hypothetical protein
MQKHPQNGQCSFTPQLLLQNLAVSKFAFSRYLGRASFINKPKPGIRCYQLPCGCYVWQHSSGVRELSALPF